MRTGQRMVGFKRNNHLQVTIVAIKLPVRHSLIFLNIVFGDFDIEIMSEIERVQRGQQVNGGVGP